MYAVKRRLCIDVLSILSAADECDENGRSKIKGSDVVAVLKDLNLEDWISETQRKPKKKKKNDDE